MCLFLYRGCPDLTQLLLSSPVKPHSFASVPNLAPGRRRKEKRGLSYPHPLHHLLPTAAAWEDAGVCTKPLAPACNKGGPGPEAGGSSQGTASRTVESQAERGLHFSPPWPSQPRPNTQQWRALLPLTQGQSPGPQRDMGGHRSPIMAVSLETWLLPFSAEKQCAQEAVQRELRGSAEPGTADALQLTLRMPEGQAPPVTACSSGLTPGLGQSSFGPPRGRLCLLVSW